RSRPPRRGPRGREAARAALARPVADLGRTGRTGRRGGRDAARPRGRDAGRPSRCAGRSGRGAGRGAAARRDRAAPRGPVRRRLGKGRVESTTGGEDLAVLLYTSGTSGTPKGAMLSHRALLANHRQLAAIDPPPVGPDDVVLLALPLFHSYGLNSGLGAVAYH